VPGRPGPLIVLDSSGPPRRRSALADRGPSPGRRPPCLPRACLPRRPRPRAPASRAPASRAARVPAPLRRAPLRRARLRPARAALRCPALPTGGRRGAPVVEVAAPGSWMI